MPIPIGDDPTRDGSQGLPVSTQLASKTPYPRTIRCEIVQEMMKTTTSRTGLLIYKVIQTYQFGLELLFGKRM